MTKRPDPFDKSALEEALLELGCPCSFLSTTISNYRLFVPLLLAELGEERVFQIVYGARSELGLGDQETAWRTSVKHLVAWAEASLAAYKARRLNTLESAAPEDEPAQPRLL